MPDTLFSKVSNSLDLYTPFRYRSSFPKPSEYFCIPRLITSSFFSNPLSSSPAPRPATISGSICNSADKTAAEVVVFPIPISPAAIIRYPLSFNSRTISIPTFIASIACSSDIAGSFRKFLVPSAIFLSSTPSILAVPRIPISTGIISTDALFPRTQAVLMPAPRLSATLLVTSHPH